MAFELQPVLRGELLEMRPVATGDFDALWAVAADPLVWELHPRPDRATPAGFERFFQIIMKSGGALAAVDRKDGRVIGCSRYDYYDEAASEIEIGGTFLARSHWGGVYNREMKRLMLAHAFRFVNRVVFTVGVRNLRSQRAVQKIGGKHVGFKTVPELGDHFIYLITSEEFAASSYWKDGKIGG